MLHFASSFGRSEDPSERLIVRQHSESVFFQVKEQKLDGPYNK